MPLEVVHRLWEWYLNEHTASYVFRMAKRADMGISYSTIQKYIKKGIPAKGIEPFEQKLEKMNIVVPKLVDVKCDMKTLEIAVANLDAWRQRVDRGVDVVDMLLARAREILAPQEDPKTGEPRAMDSKELQQASNAVKVAFDSMKRAAETHEILRGLSGVDDDGRDTWIQDNFADFTPEEHAAFRDHGIWPERLGPAPGFIDQRKQPKGLAGAAMADAPDMDADWDDDEEDGDEPDDTADPEEIQHTPVKSTNLLSVGYDAAEMVLEVRFTNGTEYRYTGVPEQIYRGLLEAPSAGQYHHQMVKDVYEFERVR